VDKFGKIIVGAYYGGIEKYLIGLFLIKYELNDI